MSLLLDIYVLENVCYFIELWNGFTSIYIESH